MKAQSLNTWESPHVPLFNGQTLLDAVANGYVVGGVPRVVDDDAVSLSDLFDDTHLELPLEYLQCADDFNEKKHILLSVSEPFGVIASLFPWTWMRQWRM